MSRRVATAHEFTPNGAERRPLDLSGLLPWFGRMSSTPVLAHSATKPRRLGQRIRLSELPIREASYDLFADLAANRAKWSFRTSSPEVLAAASDK
jgi:hypothetical protein